MIQQKSKTILFSGKHESCDKYIVEELKKDSLEISSLKVLKAI